MQPENCPWTIYHGNYPYEFPICERSLCEWIRQPANTWSNLGMVIIGLYLIFRGLRDRTESDIYLGSSIFIMGVCSFICHASGTPLFVALDVTAIFIFLSLLSALLLLRGGMIAPKIAIIYFLAFFITALGVQIFLSKGQILILILFIVLLAILEIKALNRIGEHINRRHLFYALVVLLVAAICIALDYTKTACFPDQHFFQFHALWHLLSGISMLLVANYMKQFKIKIFR